MTRDQIRLVQASFRNVLPIREQAAALFYDRLFEIDPGTRGLFADTDLRTQGGKLMAAIGMVVHALDAPETMVEKLKELARRHVNYGVEDKHYGHGRRRTLVDAAGWAWRSIHSRASRRLGVRLPYAQPKDDGGSQGSGAGPCNIVFP